jgi:hypothetical protein
LIVSLIIAIILTGVFAFLFFAERGKSQKAESDRIEAERKPVGYLPEKLDAGDIKVAKDLTASSGSSAGGGEAAPAATTGGYKSLTETLAPKATNAFDFVAEERNALAKLVSPLAVTARQAADYILLCRKDAQETVKSVAHKPQVNWNQDLGKVVKELASAYVQMDTLATNAERDRAQAVADLKKANEQNAADKTAFTDSLKKQADEAKKLNDAIAALQTAYNTQVEPIRQEYAAKLAAAEAKIPPLQKQLDDSEKGKAPLLAQIKYLSSIYPQYRQDYSENTVRRPDGYVTRITEDGKTCYINLGESDHISPGMTFEIYDQTRGIPSLKDENPNMEDENARRNRSAKPVAAGGAEKSATATMIQTRGNFPKFDTQLPSGSKGSLEVVTVGPGHSSVCRIIKPSPNIRQGDLIANLIYDPNIKPKVGVYGNFDLDYNGIPELKDADVIRRQIEVWGGRPTAIKVEDDVLPELDFLVMGIRPKVPSLAADASAGDQDLAQKIKQAAELYDRIAERARKHSIPVLNQTRFLYYTGYFDQRLR